MRDLWKLVDAEKEILPGGFQEECGPADTLTLGFGPAELGDSKSVAFEATKSRGGNRKCFQVAMTVTAGGPVRRPGWA